MQEKIKILYVDDEPGNLIGFKASFRVDFHVLTAVNIPQAINYLEAYNLSVGLLINFGRKSLEFKRTYNTKHPDNEGYKKSSEL